MCHDVDFFLHFEIFGRMHGMLSEYYHRAHMTWLLSIEWFFGSFISLMLVLLSDDGRRGGGLVLTFCDDIRFCLSKTVKIPV